MKEKRVDEYISKSADFAQPILMHLRELVHTACPQVTEVIKWGFPVFEYKGILCNMAAFRQHCAFGFWKDPLMKQHASLKEKNEKGMGHLGKIKSLGDLPADDEMISLIKEAVRLNEEGIKLPPKQKSGKQELALPPELSTALSLNKKAADTFNNFSASHKREYIEWIAEAKTEATRERRVETSIEWLCEGKTRMWKYQKK